MLSVTPAAQFLLNSANYSSLGRIPGEPDYGQPIVPLFTDYYAGGDYCNIDSCVRLTLNGDDPDAGFGLTSMKATWDGTGVNGYFQFGIGPNLANRPRDISDLGYAHTVRFMAKGDTAGEQITVNVYTVSGAYFTKQVTLPASWTSTSPSAYDYVSLPQGLKPSDLTAVQFVMGDGLPSGNKSFWVDEVRIDTDGYDPLRIVQSYLARTPSDDTTYRDTYVYPGHSYLYDNAVAIMALLATGDATAQTTAGQIAAACIATVRSDGSYYNQRNSGHVLDGNGTPLSPWDDTQTLGDNAWFGLALIDLYGNTGTLSYLNAARAVSDWAETDLKATGTLGGYYGGFDTHGTAYTWRSTEHNIDLFALNRELAIALAGQNNSAAPTYAARASYAGNFVMDMYDSTGGKFWTGTAAGDTINESSVPLDVQLWASLALPLSGQYVGAIDWSKPLSWAETNLQATDGAFSGFKYSNEQTATNDVWFEGTGQAAVLYAVQGNTTKYATALQDVEYAELNHPNKDGYGVVAASSDDLADSFLGATYDARLSASATAWLVFAQQKLDPFNVAMRMADGFETGDFAAWPWQLSNAGTASNWAVESSTVHSGSYAAQSGAIGAASSSTLSVTLTVPAGVLSFWSSVSSASASGALSFAIDGTTANQWSGAVPWQQSFYNVSAGQHTFSWIFARGTGLPAGSDAAWLDDVAFATPLVVPGSVWTAAGLTLTLGSDGNLHVYTTGTTTDVLAARTPASVSNIEITAPSSGAANLTIDSTAGNPIPTGGLTYDGAGGLIITGPGNVTLSNPNNYSRGTTLAAGSLTVSDTAALPPAGSVTFAGGNLVLNFAGGGGSVTADTFAFAADISQSGANEMPGLSASAAIAAPALVTSEAAPFAHTEAAPAPIQTKPAGAMLTTSGSASRSASLMIGEAVTVLLSKPVTTLRVLNSISRSEMSTIDSPILSSSVTTPPLVTNAVAATARDTVLAQAVAPKSSGSTTSTNALLATTIARVAVRQAAAKKVGPLLLAADSVLALW
jgi:autotransporter-associated beta strand protein